VDTVRTEGAKFIDTDVITVTGEFSTATNYTYFDDATLGGSATTGDLDDADNAASLTTTQATTIFNNGWKFVAGDAVTVEGTFTASVDYTLFDNGKIGGNATMVLNDSGNSAVVDFDDVSTLKANGTKFHSSDNVTVTGAFDSTSAYTDFKTATLGGTKVTLDDSNDVVGDLTAAVYDTLNTNSVVFVDENALTLTLTSSKSIAASTFFGGSNDVLKFAADGGSRTYSELAHGAQAANDRKTAVYVNNSGSDSLVVWYDAATGNTATTYTLTGVNLESLLSASDWNASAGTLQLRIA
jgi:hypothetical protein